MAELDIEAVKTALDPAKIKSDVKRATDKITRDFRIRRALDTPVRQRTAKDAALCALARMIQEGKVK